MIFSAFRWLTYMQRMEESSVDSPRSARQRSWLAGPTYHPSHALTKYELLVILKMTRNNPSEIEINSILNKFLLKHYKLQRLTLG